MADLYLTPAERYTAALGGFYYGDLPEPGTVYTQLIKDILNGTTPDKEPKNILARFIYSLYISDLGDPYPRYELTKLLYWKLHDITPTKSGSILTVTIDGKEDYMTINTDLSRLWYKVLFGSKTDVITDFPYIFNTMQNKLSDWELFGNVEVSGTPTPDNPIMPQGTGERTGNLFDENRVERTTWSIDTKAFIIGCYGNSKSIAPVNIESYSIGKNQITVKSRAGGCGIGVIVEIESNKTYTLSFDTSKEIVDGYSYFGFNTVSSNGSLGEYIAPLGQKVYTFNSGSAKYAYIVFRAAPQFGEMAYSNIMLNLGSTALPYEPYGYKISISCGGTTTPVYLGEVETTRKVQKLVLTGQEIIYKNYLDNANDYLYYTSVTSHGDGINNVVMCTHLPYTPSIPEGSMLGSRMSNSHKSLYLNFGADIMNSQPSGNTKAGIKEYLTAQYAAGTPVTVWYVLATEETGIVNEPLMKIGDYTDSMSRTQTGIDIPTVIGQNTLDVLTTVKPSSMRIEYTSADETRSRSKRISLLKSPLKKGLIK